MWSNRAHKTPMTPNGKQKNSCPLHFGFAGLKPFSTVCLGTATPCCLAFGTEFPIKSLLSLVKECFSAALWLFLGPGSSPDLPFGGDDACTCI